MDRLRLVYFCVVGLLMAIDEKSFVSHEYIRRIMDIDKLRAYPWGLRSFDHLVDGVIKARSDLSKPSYVLQGFAYALQIWIMEAIPDCGIMLGRKLNEGLVLYSFISATGNMDVIRDQDFVRTDEMRDERVDRMEQLISQNHDWSKRLWEAEEPVDTAPAPASAPATAPASAAQTESEVVHNEGGESTEDFRTPCGEVTSSSGSRTRKRKVIDKGAEQRKKQLLFQRSVASADRGSECFMRNLFAEYEKKMTEQKDEKYEKLASDFAKLQGVVTELKDMLTEALSRGNNGEPSSQSKPVSQVNYEQRRKAQFDVSLDKLVDINLTQSSEINFGENTQSYLFRKQGHLSQDSFVPGFDPSQQSKDKSKKSQPRNQKAKFLNHDHIFKWVDEAAHLDEIEAFKIENARLEEKLEAVTIERMEFERIVFEKVQMKIEKEIFDRVEEALVESSSTTKEMMIGAIILCMMMIGFSKLLS
ncbi:unnamed protein product [Microthlaspi erraticum]|uniref:DUF1985 domain-containing protein n=1 Tax=Microthlaspi erraticum TaxID=1685480 RepID=A0A6D2HZE9_9BRAS|nr:unnamed protein product [Microthlaspi erraticum]